MLTDVLNFKLLLSLIMLIIFVKVIAYHTHLDIFRQKIKKGDIVKFKFNNEKKKGTIIDIFEISVNIIEEGTMKSYHVKISKLFPPK